MTTSSKDDIKHAVQKDEDENPIFDERIDRVVAAWQHGMACVVAMCLLKIGWGGPWFR